MGDVSTDDKPFKTEINANSFYDASRGRPPLHLSLFISSINELRHHFSSETISLFTSLCDTLETPALNDPPEQKIKKPFPKQLTLASVNIASIYGRTNDLLSWMRREKITLCGLQEPNLSLNALPKEFNSCAFMKQHTTPGQRGLVWIFHPCWKDKLTETIPELETDQPNPSYRKSRYLHWLKVSLDHRELYACNIYLPCPNSFEDRRDAEQTVHCLLEHIRLLPIGANVILLGDWNADPFTKKGGNHKLFKHLLKSTSLLLVQRPSKYFFTRPRSKTHIDNFVVSRSAVKLISHDPAIVYYPFEEFGRMGPVPERKKPSDHCAIALPLNIRINSSRHRQKTVVWDTRPLREGDTAPYREALATLSSRWKQWELSIRSSTTPIGPPVLTILLEGARYILESAAYRTLSKRIRYDDKPNPTLSTETLSRKTPNELWRLVKNRLYVTQQRYEKKPPYQELEAQTRNNFSRIPFSRDRKVTAWVIKTNTQIAQCELPVLTDSTHLHAVNEAQETVQQVVKQLRRGITPGLDMIVSEQIKEAPDDFLEVLAILAADMRLTAGAPLKMLLGILSYIPKSGGRWRGIRRGDIIAKIIERASAHPLYPVSGPPGNLTCDEQFAGIRGLGSDLAALSLSIIITECTKHNDPLFVLFTDVDGAYDNVWREALFAKLAKMHPNILDVRLITALYDKMESIIKDKNYESSLIESLVGLAQGGPNSGHLFTTFMSDLPEDLRRAGAGAELFGLIILCLMFMDDITIPLSSAAAVTNALQALYEYQNKWYVTFNTTLPPNAKTKVLCINAPDAPLTWQFGTAVIHSATEEQYLSVTYSVDLKWNAHFQEKLAYAKKKVNALRAAGLIGGSHPPAAELVVVNAVVWPALDSGRIATNISGSGYLGLKTRLLRFQMATLREILNLSSKAPVYAVVGELAIMLDTFREEMQVLHSLRRMLNAPPRSIPARLIRGALLTAQHTSENPYLSRMTRLLTETQIKPTLLMTPAGQGHITTQCKRRAERDWRSKVALSAELSLIYPPHCSFKAQAYLDLDTFAGRTLLSKLRANDLALEAAGYNTNKPGTCPCCGHGYETRQHFLLHCRSLQQVRDQYPTLPGLQPRDQRDNEVERIRHLLLCYPISPSLLSARAQVLGTFLTHIWRERGLIIDVYRPFYP